MAEGTQVHCDALACLHLDVVPATCGVVALNYRQAAVERRSPGTGQAPNNDKISTLKSRAVSNCRMDAFTHTIHSRGLVQNLSRISW